jgi:hypothetical protein
MRQPPSLAQLLAVTGPVALFVTLAVVLWVRG